MKTKILLLSLLIFLLSFFMRSISLSKEIMVDEPTWLDRSYSFWVNLSKGKFEGTLQSGHPGVTTMVLAGSGMVTYRFIKHVPYSRSRLLEFIMPARLPIVIAISVLISLIFVLGSKLFGVKASLLAAFLFSIEPFYINFTRLVHVDGLLSVFMFTAVISGLLYYKTKREKYLIFSSFFSASSFLTKSPSVLLIPVLGAIVFFASGRQIKRFLINFMKWGIFSTAIFIAFWPALWNGPGPALDYIYRSTLVSVEKAHSTNVYIFEPFYYFAKTYFHSSPLTILVLVLGIVYGLFLIIKEKGKIFKAKFFPVLVLVAYSLLYTLLLTISAKKGERYILPALMSYIMVSAIAITRIVSKIRFKKLLYLFYFSTAMLVCLQTYGFLKLSPNFLSYFNPLMKTPYKAKLGFGEGLDLAAEYLNTKKDANNIVAAAWYPDIFSAHFKGKTIELGNWRGEKADYAVLYKGMMGRSKFDNATTILSEFNDQTPEKTIYINGMEYVWIYKISNKTIQQ